MSKLVVFTGNATPELARAMVRHLNIPLGAADVGTFSDGEVSIEIHENVRGKDVFVHISAVERAGLSSLKEGQKVKYEMARDRGKESAANLSLVE